MQEDVIAEMQGLLKETEDYEFPFFSSYEQRKILLYKKKAEIDQSMKGIVKNTAPDDFCSDAVWDSAYAEAAEQFDGMDEKQMIRSFFLQEVMHRYVEKNLEILKESYN